MKKWFASLLCCLICLTGTLPVTISAMAEEAAVTTSATDSLDESADTEEEQPSKTVRILEFLGIFTVAAGVTAFIVIRPKWKMLKEIRQQQKK